jgi:L-lactate dehydrogenase (cytochrome)
MLALLRPRRTDAPYGVRSLARMESIDDVAREAQRRLPRAVWGYLEGGSFGEHTLRRNLAAFDAIELLPSVLRDVASVTTSTTVLGAACALPLALAPVGAPGFIHPGGERAAARAAGAAGVPFALSTVGSTSIEQLAAVRPHGPLWMQLYPHPDAARDEELIERAQQAGFSALLVTVDCTVRSRRPRELRSGLSLPAPTVRPSMLFDGLLHPRWSLRFLLDGVPRFPNVPLEPRRGPARLPDLSALFDGRVNWDTLASIRRRWSGPMAVKGILTADDARRAVDSGLDAVIVSNHGGRQLDHVPASIDRLPDVVAAVGDRAEVLVDSGVRRGSDIVAALALGAKAVLVGRAYLYGLAVAGEAGVRHSIDLLAEELRIVLALTGRRSIDEVDRDLVRTFPT